MKCRECQREVCYTATGVCPQCSPLQPTRYYIVERDMEGVNLLRFNQAAKIVETTSDLRYATFGDSPVSAERAADFYGPLWHALNRGRLRVLRID